MRASAKLRFVYSYKKIAANLDNSTRELREQFQAEAMFTLRLRV